VAINTITIVGRLGRDPELKYTQGGKAVVNFSLAVDRRGKDAGADWFQVTAWDKLAELCNEHLRKGRQAAVRGRMQSRNYEAQDGSKRTSWEVVAEDVQFLGSREDAAESSPPRQDRPQTGGRQAPHPDQDLDEEDVPF
jgi:single-strand DNA-binding protein